ncbi:MAG: cytochrome c class [Spartobacteria bacterium]|nr:cytochrome c class [Spartobacteria bacterium]
MNLTVVFERLSLAVVGQALRLPMHRRGRRSARPTILTLLVLRLATTLSPAAEMSQVPTWSKDDLEFFRHGSMSTEVIPETVLRSFIKTYPEIFPTPDLSHLGLIPDPDFGWPIGFSRTKVKHLGGLAAIGINCASCHFVQVNAPGTSAPIQILGGTSHFDVEAFFGSVLVATFKTSDPINMKKFLTSYVADSNSVHADRAEAAINSAWQKQEEKILVTIKADPFGAKDVAPGELYKLEDADVRIDLQSLDHGDIDLAQHTRSLLKLFHNMRAALHIPDQPPEKLPPATGPGRNDAFGLLSAALLNAPQPYAPTKFGLVWNIGERHWVHWDGNTNSPLARNLLASLGLGAPIHRKHGDLDFAMIKKQTDLSEQIRAPRYPFAIDQGAAKRGAALFESNCNSCHGGPESDKRLYPLAEIGTDPHRAELFTERQAERFNKFLAELEAVGYEPPKQAGVRSTGKYWAATLTGVWARSPYLHNGSVRTMQQLLMAPMERAKAFHRGSRVFDEHAIGYTDEGSYVLDTTGNGNSNSGHDYGTKLSAGEKNDLLEYLKTL